MREHNAPLVAAWIARGDLVADIISGMLYPYVALRPILLTGVLQCLDAVHENPIRLGFFFSTVISGGACGLHSALGTQMVLNMVVPLVRLKARLNDRVCSSG